MENTLKKIIFKLTKSEKDYFSKFTKLYKEATDSHYISLYNLILNNGGLSLDEIKKKFGNNFPSKNLSIEKERLLEKILTSLINYNFESSFKWKIQKDINYIQILLEKELYEKAQKILERAKRNAYKYEEFELIFQIISLEMLLCFHHGIIVHYEKLKELKEERLNIFDIIDDLHSVLTIKAELQYFQINENFYTSDFNNFSKIYGHSPLAPKNITKSIKIQAIWLNVVEVSYFIQHDYQNFFKYTQERYQLVKNNMFLFTIDEYMFVLNNFMYSSSLVKNEEMFSILIEEFSNIKNLNTEHEFFKQKIIFYRTLEIYHQVSKYKQGEELARKAEQFLEIHHQIPNFENRLLHLNIIRAYIDNDNYSLALNSSQKKYRVTGLEYNSSIFKLFEFIIHYKLNNYNSLICSLDSWTKTIRSKRKQFPIEKVLIKFFRSICNKATIKEKKQLIKSTIVQLQEIEKTNLKFYLNHIFDFTAWFERELEEMK